VQRGLENEKKLNDNYMRKKHGQKVNFGDIIQVGISYFLFFMRVQHTYKSFSVVVRAVVPRQVWEVLNHYSGWLG
jgi:hypothetical protein